MRTVGIIAEYNPFHTGHEYHIQKARELTGADYVIVVMSPDFVQRGEPAVFDKYTRTQMALQGGADLVIELPVCYATGSAEYFAEGAVGILNALGAADMLCFGCESDDIDLFQRTADILLREPQEFKEILRSRLKQGKNYPLARSEALMEYLRHASSISSSAAPVKEHSELISSSFLSTPNNILGIEYCKALRKCSSSITPVPLLRQGNGYNSSSLDGSYCSATAVRTYLNRRSSCEDTICSQSASFASDILNEIGTYIPVSNHKIFAEAARMPLNSEHFLSYFYQKLLSEDDFSSVLDITADLSDRIKTNRFKCIGKSYTEIVSLLKTRQIAESRIRRALLHLILNIRQEDMELFRSEGTVSYARVLGFRKSASPLLHDLKHRSQIPLVVKTSAAEKELSETAKRMWKQDFYASHLYRSILTSTYTVPFRTEYECSPIRL